MQKKTRISLTRRQKEEKIKRERDEKRIKKARKKRTEERRKEIERKKLNTVDLKLIETIWSNLRRFERVSGAVRLGFFGLSRFFFHEMRVFAKKKLFLGVFYTFFLPIFLS